MTVFSIAAFAVEVAALIVYLVGFISAQWGWLSINADSGEHTGLWRRCRDVANKPLSCENLLGNQAVPGAVHILTRFFSWNKNVIVKISVNSFVDD